MTGYVVIDYSDTTFAVVSQKDSTYYHHDWYSTPHQLTLSYEDSNPQPLKHKTPEEHISSLDSAADAVIFHFSSVQDLLDKAANLRNTHPEYFL